MQEKISFCQPASALRDREAHAHCTHPENPTMPALEPKFSGKVQLLPSHNNILFAMKKNNIEKTKSFFNYLSLSNLSTQDIDNKVLKHNI